MSLIPQNRATWGRVVGLQRTLECQCQSQGSLRLWEARVPVRDDDEEVIVMKLSGGSPPDLQTVCLGGEGKI